MHTFFISYLFAELLNDITMLNNYPTLHRTKILVILNDTLYSVNIAGLDFLTSIEFIRMGIKYEALFGYQISIK